MANTIRIKRRTSGASGAPASLENAEPAFNEVDSTLYIGIGTGGAGGSATSALAIGGPGAFATLSSNQTISGLKTFSGGANFTAGTVDFTGSTVSGISGFLPSSGGTVSGNVTVTGNLTVSGTTTTVDSTTVTVADKNIELGKVTSPSDTTADGGGLTLKGTTDKTFNWVDATDAWTSSEHLNLASGKAYYINGTSVLSGTTLGSGVTGSSLTSVGTIGTGTWQGTVVGAAYGGTGVDNTGKTITLGGNVSTGGAFTTSGANALTLTTTGATNVTLPTTGTLITNAVSSLSSLTTVGAIGTGTWQADVIAGAYGGTGVANTGKTITLGGNISTGGAFTTSGANALTLTTSGATNVTLPTSGTLITDSVTSLASLATVGTIGTGTWQGSVIAGAYGGTGVANTGKTITLGGNISTAGALTTSGAFGVTLTATATTSVTLPTSGTLLSDASAIDGGTF